MQWTLSFAPLERLRTPYLVMSEVPESGEGSPWLLAFAGCYCVQQQFDGGWAFKRVEAKAGLPNAPADMRQHSNREPSREISIHSRQICRKHVIHTLVWSYSENGIWCWFDVAASECSVATS